MVITIWIIMVIIAGFINALSLGKGEGFFTWLLRQAASMLWITILVALAGWAIREVFGG